MKEQVNKAALKQIKAVVTDVDGVLTDGKITYDANGIESKSFNVKDGMGFKLLSENNIQVYIITGRKSSIVEKRASELKVKKCYQGIKDKDEVLVEIMKTANLGANELVCIGDDVNDLSILHRAGLAACPADAHSSVREICQIKLERRGGDGAFRELVDLILDK